VPDGAGCSAVGVIAGVMELAIAAVMELAIAAVMELAIAADNYQHANVTCLLLTACELVAQVVDVG
jgi:hypothetical protein